MFKKKLSFFTSLHKQFTLLDMIYRQTQLQVEIESKKFLLLANQELERLQDSPKLQDKKNLVRFGHKIFSQNDEDGIIKEIFQRIGITNKVFVEFGIGDGLENNTLALLFDGWKGLWIDAAPEVTEKISTNYKLLIDKKQLTFIQAFITKKNINEIILSNITENEIDLLSIDIDGNDYHILDTITAIIPRVIIIEYNAKFPPPIMYCMGYDEEHTWKNDDCFGASLKFLEVKLREKGYYLVGCNITGSNAFFVKKDLIGDKFLQPYSAENHYMKARYYLSGLASGHTPSYQTLSKSLE